MLYSEYVYINKSEETKCPVNLVHFPYIFFWTAPTFDLYRRLSLHSYNEVTVDATQFAPIHLSVRPICGRFLLSKPFTVHWLLYVPPD
jgi:hypothetical protein